MEINRMQKLFLILAMICAVAVIAVSFTSYQSARKELSGLKADLETSTAAWKKINEDKLVVQKELKEVKNQLREANLTLEESEEKAKSIEEEIASLEKEIETLKSTAP